MLLHVTQEAIDKAWARDDNCCILRDCLLATAAKLQFDTEDVACGTWTIGINGKDYRIPEAGTVLVKRWLGDRPNNPPQPTQVELTPM